MPGLTRIEELKQLLNNPWIGLKKRRRLEVEYARLVEEMRRYRPEPPQPYGTHERRNLAALSS
jgi:hypothetical protein